MSTAYPICGDPNHYRGFFYCSTKKCSLGKYWYYKVVDDSGDVCLDEQRDCGC